MSKPEAQRANCTIKISRIVRDHIEKNTTLAEPTDRTLRRLLGLKLPKGEFGPKIEKPAKKKGDKADSLWTTIKITASLRDHITAHAGWSESVDVILRRLLRLPMERDKAAKVAK